MTENKDPKKGPKKGQFYFCVKVPTHISEDGEIYLHADNVECYNGALVFRVRRENVDGAITSIVFAPGQWFVYYTASVLDGSPIGVEHWMGEIVSRRGGLSGD